MRIQFDDISFEIQLRPLQSKGNEEYTIMDTGCVLGVLRRFDEVLHRLENGMLRVAILEVTLNEVREHLLRSQSALSRKGFSTFGVRSGIMKLRKLLQDGRVKKIANPVISEKALLSYKHFREDRLLAYVLFEGNYKAVATQDKSLAKRVGEDRCMSCEQLWTNQS